ncbi:cell division protein PerM [Corynebacterium freiburgense]|uniref:cell division protein PerM n=1 Tax=Corynebacterium freiburgense TaxID=556548 RepID=UPI0006886E35|nr:DUF6350 family protein [Corynebacterium freiburgense]WJZ02067.1 hypothetical protein CFREI_03840 [Corynebacterium freiburgense]
MNRKNSPQQRDRRSPKTRGSGRNSRLRTTRRAARATTPPMPEAQKAPPQLKDRAKATLVTILVPVAITVLFLVGFALAGLIFTNTSLVALPATVAQAWLVLNLVPVSGLEATVGILPLGPALVFGWLLARRMYRSVKDRVSMVELQLTILWALGIPLLLTLTATAMLYDASSVLPVQPPSLGDAIVRTLLMHLCVVGIGMGPRLWRALARRIAVPGMLVDAALYALQYLRWLTYIGLITVLISMAFHWESLRDLFQNFPTAGGIAALIGISLLYLLNAALFAAAVLLGSEFHIGDASISLFSAHLIPLPPVPLFAAVPASVVPWAWVFLIIPLALAAIMAYRRMGESEHPIAEFIAAGGFLILFTAIAMYLAGGELGVFAHIGSLVWLTSLLAFVFVSGTGVLAVMVHRVLGPKGEDEDEPEEEEPKEEPQEEKEEQEEEQEEQEPEQTEETPEADTENTDERDVDTHDIEGAAPADSDDATRER